MAVQVVSGSEFNYFAPHVVNYDVLAEDFQHYGPVATIQPGAPIEFQIPGIDDQYLDLASSYMEVSMRLLAADGANLAQGTLVGTSNLTLHSLFRSVDVEVFGKVISDSNHLYPYRSIMETLFNYPKDVLTTGYSIEGFVQDTAVARTMEDTSLAQAGTNFERTYKIASKLPQMFR